MNKNKLKRGGKSKSGSKNIFLCCFGSSVDETSELKSCNVTNFKNPVSSNSESRVIQENTLTESEFHYLTEGKKTTHPKFKLTLDNSNSLNSYFYNKNSNEISNEGGENKDLVKNILTRYLEMKRADTELNSKSNNKTETEIMHLKNFQLENDFSSETDESLLNLCNCEKNCESCSFSSKPAFKKEKRNLEVVFTHSNDNIMASVLTSPLTKVDELSQLDSDELSLQYKISCDGTPSVIGSFSAEKLLQHNKNKMNTTAPSQELYIIKPTLKGDLLGREESGASLKWKLVISNHGGKLPK